MHNGEFNKVEITNEKQISGLEFGKTQRTETISQKENKLPEGELNEKYVGKTIRKQTEVNVQYANKASAPAHGSTTVTTTSATTASSVAATSASVVTAASVVAVAAIAVGTGISVALHDYDYKINYFEIGSNYVVCDLFVMDNKRPDGEPYERYWYGEEMDLERDNENSSKAPEEKPFVLRVYNDVYERSYGVKLGVCEWYFDELEPDQKYHIALSEKRFGGETLFDEVFRTKKEETRVSEFRNFVFDKTANFIDRTFDVRLDFVDDYNLYSDFVLTFIYMLDEPISSDHPEENEFSIDVPLEKTTEVQTIDLDGIEISLSESYKYRLSCKYDGEDRVLEEGEVTFTDNSGAIVEFHELIFDKTANFDNRTFDVQLDYQDDLYYLYSFQFILTDLETEETRTFYLLQTTDVQTIEVNEITGYDDYEEPIYAIDVVNHRMKYSFKYMNQDQEFIVVEDEEFKFKNSLVSTFQGIETSYDFYAETSDRPYNIALKFLYDDAAHVYNHFAVDILYQGEDYAYLSFEGDTVTHDWLYGTMMNSVDGPYDPITIINSNDVSIRVTASMLNVDAEETGGPDVIEQVIYTEDDVTFTLNENPTIYGGNMINNQINAGDYEVSFMPIYTGQPEEYSVFLIFECETGKKYTCGFSLPYMGSYTYVSLRESEEGFDDDAVWQDFGNPVKVSIKYCRVEEGVTPSEVDYTTMVLFESFVFELSA